MKKREIERRRWEFEEAGKKKIIVPTVKEVAAKENLSLEEAAKRCLIICGKAHQESNKDCFRKTNGHKLCDGCPKYYPEKTKRTTITSEWAEETEVLLNDRLYKLVSKRR
jgi:hypothetical protein